MSRAILAVLIVLFTTIVVAAEPRGANERRVASIPARVGGEGGPAPAVDVPAPVPVPTSASETAPLKLGPAGEGWATTRLVGVFVIMLLGLPVWVLARRR